MLKREKLKIKKRFIVLILFFCLFFIWAGYVYLSPRKIIREEGLSERGRQLLEDQKKKDSKWANINLNEKDSRQTKAGVVKVGDCLEFYLPYPIKEERKKDGCFTNFLVYPTGSVIVYMSPDEVGLEENPHIKMRRMYPDKYQEEESYFEGVRFLIFKEVDPAGYKRSAFAVKDGYLLVFNLNISTLTII